MTFGASNGVEEEDQAEQANIQIIFILLSVERIPVGFATN